MGPLFKNILVVLYTVASFLPLLLWQYFVCRSSQWWVYLHYQKISNRMGSVIFKLCDCTQCLVQNTHTGLWRDCVARRMISRWCSGLLMIHLQHALKRIGPSTLMLYESTLMVYGFYKLVDILPSYPYVGIGPNCKFCVNCIDCLCLLQN